MDHSGYLNDEERIMLTTNLCMKLKLPVTVEYIEQSCCEVPKNAKWEIDEYIEWFARTFVPANGDDTEDDVPVKAPPKRSAIARVRQQRQQPEVLPAHREIDVGRSKPPPNSTKQDFPERSGDVNVSMPADTTPLKGSKPKEQEVTPVELFEEPEFVRFRRSVNACKVLQTRPDPSDSWAFFRWRCAVIIESAPAKGAVIFLICTNGILIGIYANGQMTDEIFTDVDLAFTLFFAVEISMKMIGFGLKIFFADAWNVFDFCIVAFSMIEGMIEEFPVDATVARLVRVVRVMRFFRLVSSLRSLNLLVVALWQSFLAVAWVGILAILLLYMFGCVATTVFGNDPTMQDEMPVETQHFFGSVQRSMLTLLQIMTLDSWASEVTRKFLDKFPGVSLLTIPFMALAALGLMNLLAAIYVDKLMQLTSEASAKAAVQAAKEKEAIAAKLKAVFAEFDEDGNGVLTEDELMEGIKALDTDGSGGLDENELSAAFREAGLKAEDAIEVIQFLVDSKESDDDGEAEIDSTTFLENVFALHNTATRKDTLEILSTLKSTQKDLEAGMASIGRRLNSPLTTPQSSPQLVPNLPPGHIENRLSVVEQRLATYCSIVDNKLDLILQKLENL